MSAGILGIVMRVDDCNSIIHDANPRFDRKRMMYLYPNGVEQRIVVNLHLR